MSAEIDRDDHAEGSTYTDVYDAIIDSVTQVRVFGVEDPLTQTEGRGQDPAFYDDRHLVTNEHVVADGEEVDLQYINGDWTATKLVGVDRFSDLAVLEADHVPDAATPLSLTEQRPVVGQQVLAIGNPYGLEGSMSAGVVSGVNRTLDAPGGAFVPERGPDRRGRQSGQQRRAARRPRGERRRRRQRRRRQQHRLRHLGRSDRACGTGAHRRR